MTPGIMIGNSVIGCPSAKEAGSKISSVKDTFVSGFSSQQSKGESLVNFPRIAVAGAKPAVFAPRERVREGGKTYSLSDGRRWKKDSILWEHKLKCKAAVSWTSFVRENPICLAAVAVNNESKSVGKVSKNQTHKVDRAPLTYIIASNE